MKETLETNLGKKIARRTSVSLLDSLLWGYELEEVERKSSPSSPSTPLPSTPAAGNPPTQRASWSSLNGHYAYGRRAHAALDTICAIQSPEGLVVWLNEHSPSLYHGLTRDLPDEISRAWNARIPLETFDTLCSRLVDTFRFAAELYSNSKQTPNLFEQRKTRKGCV